MKTPEKIKNGLKNAKHVQCMEIASDNENGGTHYGVLVGYVLRDEIFAYIQQLESSLAQVERERDAAVNDLNKAMLLDEAEFCTFCKNIKKPYCHSCEFEWRGVCAANTKEEGK